MLYSYLLNVWGSEVGYISACAFVYGDMDAIAHACACVSVHMCMYEWAQVDCELGRWTFGTAL